MFQRALTRELHISTIEGTFDEMIFGAIGECLKSCQSMISPSVAHTRLSRGMSATEDVDRTHGSNAEENHQHFLNGGKQRLPLIQQIRQNRDEGDVQKSARSKWQNP